MINILPPELKHQVEYSKRNVDLVRYLLFALLASVILSAMAIINLVYSNRQISNLQNTLQERQQERQSYADTEAKVQTLQTNLNLIDKLLNEKTQYSLLLGDLAAVLPSGSYISTMTLEGDDKKPLHLVVFTDTLDTAGLIRNALLTSGRIKSVDVQSITRDEENNVYSVDIIAAFEEGQAR